MRAGEPTLPIHFVRELLRGLRAPVRRRDAWLTTTGIDPGRLADDAARVGTAAFATLYQRLAVEFDDELPGMFSRPVRAGSFRFICLGLLDASSVRTATFRLTRALRFFLDDFTLDLSRHGPLTRLALRPNLPAAESVFAQEIVLRLVHGLASWLSGRPLPVAQLDLAYRRPAHAADYAWLFPGPVHFARAATEITFETRWLDTPIRQDRRALGEFLRRAPGDWLFPAAAERQAAREVRRLLTSRLDASAAITEVAAAMHVSVRTLSRQLREEGGSFQAIKDELRREIAVRYLTTTSKPLAVIGAELGFESPATFHRAFRAWTGSTPGDYRRRPPP